MMVVSRGHVCQDVDASPGLLPRLRREHLVFVHRSLHTVHAVSSNSWG
jgi:hypothetical protein